MKNNKVLYFSVFILLVYLSPHYNFFVELKILIGDNLNQHVAINKILSDNGSLFAEAHKIVPYLMGGVQRGFLKSEINFSVLLYNFLDVSFAYSLNRIILHLVAFLGMLLLLKRYIFKENSPVIPLIALGFSTLPFFPNGFLTIAGQPLLLFAYLNVFNKKDNFKDWLVIALFPFFSSLILGNIFFHFFLILYLIIFRNYYKLNLKIIIFFLLFALSTIVCEYRLFELLFFLDFESFRSEMLRLGTLNLKGFLGTSLIFLKDGHRHFASLHFPIILVLILYYLTTIRNFRTNIQFYFLLFVLTFATFFENFFYGWSVLNPIKYYSNFLNSFTFRFYSILPLVWYLLFSISIKNLRFNIKFSYVLCFLVVLNNFFGTFNLSAENSFYHTYFNRNSKTHFSIKNYYSESFISDIKKDLNINSISKVGCVGFPSVILNYNNINTLGGFLNNYPICKKDVLRSVMLNEFEKSDVLYDKFNNYGVYCEIQSAELNSNSSIKEIKNLEIDLKILNKEGCNFLFSVKPIINLKQICKNSFVYNNLNLDSYLKVLYVYAL